MQLTRLTTYKNRVSSLLTRHLFFCVVALLFFSFSALALGINATYTHYLGNNYFPVNITWIAIALILMYVGFCIQYDSSHHLTQRVKEIFFFFSIMALILLGNNAIQYTPFSTIDHKIIRWSEPMHVDFARIIAWSNARPALYKTMEWIYDSLTYQLTYLPLILILLGRFERVHEYYLLLISTALIGYVLYYFFPTTAPASVIDSPYFTEAQHATELKFIQIHNHIKPSTMEGGMIALPSFHVIWAWLCVWLVRDWSWAFRALLLLNVGIMISCVLLGWHYILDVIASIVILAFAHGVHHYSRRASSQIF